MRRRADAGAHQHRRRMYRAGGEDYFFRPESLHAAWRLPMRADRAAAFEDQRQDMALRRDAQIGPRTDLVGEIADRGRDAATVAVVLRRGEIAVDESAVLIFEIRQIGFFERLGDAPRVAAPLL